MSTNDMFVIIIVCTLISLMCAISQLRNDVTRLQSALDRISKQVGVPDIITEEIKTELIDLISKGKKIEAIKKYRLLTGASLKDSKDYIDQLSVHEI